MAEEIAFENGSISNLTLTLDRVILHAATSTFMPNFIEIEETFVQMYGHLRPTLLGRLRRVDLKITAARMIRLDVEMFHHESLKPIHFVVKRSSSWGTKTVHAWVFTLLWVLASSCCCVLSVKLVDVCHIIGTAVGKLLTLGGVGIWWIVDIILLVLGELRPADDSNWVPYYWHH